MATYTDKGILRVYHKDEAGATAPEACISAHGGYNPRNGWATVPAGATAYFYQLHGSTQSDAASRTLMRGLDSRPTSLGNGEVWNYHLSQYEEDIANIPEDLRRMAAGIRSNPRDPAPDAFLYKHRDIVSIRVKDKDLDKTQFPSGDVPLQYVFDTIADLNYRAFHMCFCRWEFFAPGNRLARQHIRTTGV